LGRPPGCGRTCPSALLAYAGPAGQTDALISLPGNVLLRAGDRLSVRISPEAPDRASLVEPSRQVRVDGLLASAAVVALCVGLALLVASPGPREGLGRHGTPQE